MNPLQALVENLRQPKADYCLRCRRACAAALAAALVAGGTLRESIDSLMAFGEGEQEGRRKAGDREQYQFYGGWVAALQRVLALLAVERGTAAEKVPYFEVSHHELERDLLRASAFWWECYRQFQHEIPSHCGFLGENVVIMWRSDFETLQAATSPLPPAEAVAEMSLEAKLHRLCAGFEKNGIRLYERVCVIDVPRIHGTVIRIAEDGVDVRWDDGTLGELVWNIEVAYNAWRLQVIRAEAVAGPQESTHQCINCEGPCDCGAEDPEDCHDSHKCASPLPAKETPK